jgi:hypothetical protein
MTPYEQAHPRGITDRLSEEEPDVLDASPDLGAETQSEQAALTEDVGLDDEVLREASERGQLADEAGGSVAAMTRTPDEPY